MNDKVNKFERVIQEHVPGKEVTLIHLIANLEHDLANRLNVHEGGHSLGLVTVSPNEAAIVVADLSVKSGAVVIEQVDQSNGCVVISGDFSSVECALKKVEDILGNVMHFAVCPITRT